MKNADKLLLAMIFFSMLVVTTNSAFSVTAIEKKSINLEASTEGNLSAETIAIGEAITADKQQEEQNKEQPSDIMTDEYFTPNGMMLTIGKIINSEDKEKSEIVSLAIDDKILKFNISMAPYSTWTYAQIDDMLIVPVQSASINTSETSYYPSGNELIIKIDPGELHELQIYTGSKGSPSVIIPKTSISWNYDANQKIVTIQSKDVIKDNIVMFWVGFSKDDGTIFIEDMQKLETLNYRLNTMNEEKINLNNDVAIGKDKLSTSESDLSELKLKAENISKSNEEVSDNLTISNMTVSNLESIITANVAVSPSIAIIWAIVAIILIILLIDVFLFKPKRSAEK
jgi:hypothetical protein